jgi:uncharacterized membrane protein YadS
VVTAPPWWAYIPALLLTGVAYGVHFLPVVPFRVVSASGARYPVSAAIIAIVAGLFARNLLPLPAAAIESAKGLARRVIPITIVLTGAGLNLLRVSSLGFTALTITVVCMAVAMEATIWIARLLRVGRKTALLIGVGTAICGTSAHLLRCTFASERCTHSDDNHRENCTA